MPSWTRTCQSCGHAQQVKPPKEPMTLAYREAKCKKCKSPDLDYGREIWLKLTGPDGEPATDVDGDPLEVPLVERASTPNETSTRRRSVFIVEVGEYSSRGVDGAFSTRDKAETYLRSEGFTPNDHGSWEKIDSGEYVSDQADIAEYELDRLLEDK